jgi:hypothetical protein
MQGQTRHRNRRSATRWSVRRARPRLARRPRQTRGSSSSPVAYGGYATHSTRHWFNNAKQPAKSTLRRIRSPMFGRWRPLSASRSSRSISSASSRLSTIRSTRSTLGSYLGGRERARGHATEPDRTEMHRNRTRSAGSAKNQRFRVFGPLAPSRARFGSWAGLGLCARVSRISTRLGQHRGSGSAT